MKRVYKNKKRRRSTGQQSGTKSACGPADTPVVNRSSTARCVPRSGLHWISFVRASEETSRTVAYGALEGKDGRLVVSLAHRPAAATSRPDPPRPAPPRSPRPPCRRAPSRPGPPMVCLGFGLYKYTYTYIYIYIYIYVFLASPKIHWLRRGHIILAPLETKHRPTKKQISTTKDLMGLAFLFPDMPSGALWRPLAPSALSRAWDTTQVHFFFHMRVLHSQLSRLFRARAAISVACPSLSSQGS